MISCLNGEFTEHPSIDPTQDRGFQYGDGLFETIKFQDNTIPSFDYHTERLFMGLKQLKIEIPQDFTTTLEQMILQTCHKNKLQDARIKLMVWRNWGGLYTPTQTSLSYLISVAPLLFASESIATMSVAETKIPLTPYSNLKTLSALPYVLAGIEKSNSIFEELLLLNTDNKICECTSSNIFWETNSKIYTPSLASGCIAGIGRRTEIELLKNKKTEVNQGLFTIEKLKLASKIWTTNVFGKRYIQRFIA